MMTCLLICILVRTQRACHIFRQRPGPSTCAESVSHPSKGARCQSTRSPTGCIMDMTAYPDDAKSAFESSTLLGRFLVSRAHASRVAFRYCKKTDSPTFGSNPLTSQGYNKGNVIVYPQDSLTLSSVLPHSVLFLSVPRRLLFARTSPVCVHVLYVKLVSLR
jgi:hypothetical protein